MGMLFPCLLAGILNGCALQIFREPMKVGNGPLMALYIFIFTTFILLWSVRLYPRNLRKIGRVQPLIEFFTAEFLMEDLIIDFWFPLEKLLIDSLPALAQNIDDWVSAGDWSAEVITDVLKNDATGYYVSYTLASFFLIATLHASRVIDLRTLRQDGPTCFLKEIIRKMKASFRRIFRKLGFGGKRKVKINEQRSPSKLLRNGNSQGCGVGSSRNKNSVKNERQSQEYCPLHNPIGKSDSDSDFDHFEDLATMSKSDFS